ncbi:AzlD domain-containing protein [Rothia terrae]|uniref:AzlD domain-containing protein n=1 Tax=Rothia terrae TaxID=396015 RepID=A0A7H2BCZ2_9MICC|nr:AzlD domain-containing protein [Rothia terrae]QNV37538.1 AzlD domain-containing protein [Rothia terrae]
MPIDVLHTLALIAVAAAVTFSLRFVPMLTVRAIATNPYVLAIGKMLPGGIMVILVVYSINHGEFHGAGGLLALAVALGSTIGLYLWRKNVLLALVAGVLIYGALTFG